MAGAIGERKRDLRALIRSRRAALGEAERAGAASRIAGHLRRLTADHAVACVSAYLSGPQEPGTRVFLDWARRAGVRVLLPISRPGRILDWGYDDGSEIMTAFGVPETAAVARGPQAIDEAGLLFVPAAAVGLDGTRLGWGGGYFDTMLGGMRKCPQVYAVLFDGELVAEVPRQPHDSAVDGVVTPSRIVRLSRRGRPGAREADAATGPTRAS